MAVARQRDAGRVESGASRSRFGYAASTWPGRWGQRQSDLSSLRIWVRSLGFGGRLGQETYVHRNTGDRSRTCCRWSGQVFNACTKRQMKLNWNRLCRCSLFISVPLYMLLVLLNWAISFVVHRCQPNARCICRSDRKGVYPLPLNKTADPRSSHSLFSWKWI